MNNEVIVLDAKSDELLELDATPLNDDDLPNLLNDQIVKLNLLEANIEKAIDAAKIAKEKADLAKNKSAGLGKKKAAIEELQSAGVELAEAVQSGIDSQKISFEFQTNLAKISKYLLGLGLSNMARNRIVVREIEMKLKGASQEEISELARQELIAVVKQLKEQEDILKKQDKVNKVLKDHNERLDVQSNKIHQIDSALECLQGYANKQNELLSTQVSIIEELDNKLEEHSERTLTHKEQLILLNENTNDIVRKINAQDEKIKILEEEIEISKGLNKKNKIISNLALIFAILACFFSVSRFF